jgi:integrase/recombinase XerD
MESTIGIFQGKNYPNTGLNAYLISLHHTPQTVNSYGFIIKRFLRDNPMAIEYSYRDVFDYVKKRVLNQPKRQSLSLLQAGVKKYYDFLIHAGIRQTHPCNGLFLKQKRSPLVHYDLFSPNELELLFKRKERYKMLKQRNQIIISLLIYQGLTLSEVVGLTIKQIDLDAGTIRLRKSRTLNARKLDLYPKQINWISRYLMKDRQISKYSQEQSSRLLLNKRGQPISIDAVQHIIETFRVLFPGRKLSMSSIRQSVISNWLNIHQIPLDQVQLLAGHKCMSSTQRYQQENMQRQVELMNKHFPI